MPRESPETSFQSPAPPPATALPFPWAELASVAHDIAVAEFPQQHYRDTGLYHAKLGPAHSTNAI